MTGVFAKCCTKKRSVYALTLTQVEKVVPPLLTLVSSLPLLQIIVKDGKMWLDGKKLIEDKGEISKPKIWLHFLEESNRRTHGYRFNPPTYRLNHPADDALVMGLDP